MKTVICDASPLIFLAKLDCLALIKELLGDRATLNWGIRNRPDWLLADERLLRRIAVAEGLAVIGTLGLLVGAARSGRLTGEETRLHIDDLVARHGFRISVELYRKTLTELAAL